MKNKKLISRQVANKIKFFSYVFIFVATSSSLIVDSKLDNGSLNSVLEGVIEILICITYLIAAILIFLTFYMDISPKIEKKDELYIHNEQLADALTLRITMIALITASAIIHSKTNISINSDTFLLAYSVVGLISSGSMLILDRNSKNTDSDEDEV